MVINDLINKEVNKVISSLKGKVVFFLCNDKIVRGKIEVHDGTGELVVKGQMKDGSMMVFNIDYSSTFFFSKAELIDSLEVIDLAKGVK